FKAGDGSSDDGANAILELLVDAASLILADKLDHDLLDGLRADSANNIQRNRLALTRGGNVTTGAIDADGKFAGILRVKLLAQTRGDRLLDVRVDLVALNVLVACNSIHDADKFLIHWLSLFSCSDKGRNRAAFKLQSEISDLKFEISNSEISNSNDEPFNDPSNHHQGKTAAKQKSHLSAAHCFRAKT